MKTNGLDKILDRFSKIKKVYRYSIFAGFNVLLIAAFVFLFYTPKFETINTLNKEIEELDKKVQEAKAKAAKLKYYEKEYEKSQEELQRVSKILPDSSEIPELLKTINKIGEQCDLKFMVFAPEGQIDKGEFFELPVNIEVRGRFHNVAKFLSLLTSMDRLAVTSNLNITPQPQPTYSVIAKIKTSTFWLKEARAGAPQAK